MSNIVRYIHSLGLKAGIYTDAGANGCGFYAPDIGPKEPHTGSEGHYDQDFLQFAKWGFDYVKVDWCGGNTENLDPAVQYAAIAQAIARAERMTGHKLYYSICNWGNNSPWTWAPGVGGVTADVWRTSGDIVAPVVANSPNSGRKAAFSAVLSNFDHGIHPEAEHTGFYNDPDMMVIGMPRLSESQNRVHMSLWAISAAPLLVGADLSRLDSATIRILTNPQVIAVDQDSLGLQGILVAQPAAGLQVWSKPLAAAGEHAVVLLNRTAAPAQIAAKWSEIGLVPDSTAAVRDLWAGKDMGSYSSAYSTNVPAGDAVLLRIRGKEEKAVRYTADSKSGAAKADGSTEIGDEAERTVTFEAAPMQSPAFIRIEYINHGSPRIARLRVNGQIATNVNFPSTGKGHVAGAITLEANLDKSQKKNRLTFSFPCTGGADIRAIAVSGRNVEISSMAK
jgi:hypothetical protein